jgi:hypothetical protein
MTDKSGFPEATARADVIMVLGEHGLQSGEGRSRSDLGLPEYNRNCWKQSLKPTLMFWF